jgi:hypothetical protein
MKNAYNLFKIILFLSILHPLQLISGNPSRLITELNVFDNDTTYQYSYLYDTNGNVAVETKYYIVAGNKVRLSQKEVTNNGNGTTTQWEKTWSGTNWNNVFKIDTDSLNGHAVSEVYSAIHANQTTPIRYISYLYTHSLLSLKSEYNYVNNNWLIGIKTSYSYNTNNQPDTVTVTNYQSGIEFEQYQSVYFYNNDGTLSAELIQQKTPTTAWVNTQLNSWFFYPGTTNIRVQRAKIWNLEFGIWENSQNIEYEYTVDNQLKSETYQHWKTMFWVDDLRYNYVYDSNGLETKKTLSLPIYHEWRNMTSINYSDYIGGLADMIQSQYEYWGGNTGDLVTAYIPFDFNNSPALQKGKRLEIITTSNGDTTGVTQIKGQNQQIPVYPNPSKGIFYINTLNYNILSWKVSTVDGRILKTMTQPAQSGVIDLNDLPKGVYLLHVETSENKYVVKLIKE